MDVAEFRRLAIRVVMARNSEMRAFRKAFDLGPGTMSGWPERACADWLVWGANDALRGAVAELKALLAADGP
jgi:hypothetical protein